MESEQQVFYITIASLAAGLVVACMKFGYRSKCSEVSIGCLTIKRDVITENKYDLEHPIEDEEDPPRENKTQLNSV